MEECINQCLVTWKTELSMVAFYYPFFFFFFLPLFPFFFLLPLFFSFPFFFLHCFIKGFFQTMHEMNTENQNLQFSRTSLFSSLMDFITVDNPGRFSRHIHKLLVQPSTMFFSVFSLTPPWFHHTFFSLWLWWGPVFQDVTLAATSTQINVEPVQKEQGYKVLLQ